MRIRKNARVVTSSSSFLVCQLNRSPWDIIDASLLQGDDFGFNNANGDSCYFPRSIPASDSHPSGESMELSFEYVEKTPPNRETEEVELIGIEEEEVVNVNLNANVNRRGFEVVKKESPVIPAPPPKKRGRPRKHPITTPTPTPPTPSPYEFYYYSGFGPQWGKTRRGAHNNYHEDEDDSNSTRVMESTQASSSTSHMISEDEDDDTNYTHRTKNNKMRDTIKRKDNNSDNGVDLLDSVADGELDYIEDDSDEDRGGRPRVRKPIKARSLKSLM